MEHRDEQGTGTTTQTADMTPLSGGSVAAVRGDHPARSLGERAAWTQRDLGWEDLVEEARRLGPDPVFRDLCDTQVEAQVCGLAAEIAAMTARWLDLLCEFVVRGIWADQGARTPAQWLSWKVGLATSTAREHIRVAVRLRELPQVRARFGAGTLSYSKVRAITRVALPEIEDLVLTWADVSTAAQLEQIASDFRTVRRAADGPDVDDHPQHRYSWRTRTHGDGTMTLTLRAPVEQCAELCSALERRIEVAHEADAEVAKDRHGGGGDPAGGEDGSGPADGEDGGGPADREHGGDRLLTPPGGRACALINELVNVVAQAAADLPSDTSGLDRHTLVLYAPVDALASEDPQHVTVSDAHGRVRGMDRRTLRRLACEAGIVLGVVGGDGTPMDLGRRDRRLSAALRRALHLRDRTCRFPGCDATRHLHAHHVQHWSEGGPTDLGNLVLLCSFHHRFIHRAGWGIDVRRDGQHLFRRSDGRVVDRRPGGTTEQVGDRRGSGSPRPLTLVPDLEALQPHDVELSRGIHRDTIVAVLEQEISRLAPDLVAAA